MLFHSPSNLFLVALSIFTSLSWRMDAFPFSKQPVFGCHYHTHLSFVENGCFSILQATCFWLPYPYSPVLSWRMDPFPFSKQPVFGCHYPYSPLFCGEWMLFHSPSNLFLVAIHNSPSLFITLYFLNLINSLRLTRYRINLHTSRTPSRWRFPGSTFPVRLLFAGILAPAASCGGGARGWGRSPTSQHIFNIYNLTRKPVRDPQ